MLGAARDVVALVAGRVKTDLEIHMAMRRALVHALQEIGEAASKVSPHGRARLAEVEWKKIVGMRHRLVHEYDHINLDIVWKVATEEIGSLIAAMEEAFESWPLPEPPSEGESE